MIKKRIDIIIFLTILGICVGIIQFILVGSIKKGPFIYTQIILFLIFILFILYLIYMIRINVNKSLNNHSNWKTISVRRRGLFELDHLNFEFEKNYIKLEDNENIIAGVDFEFYPVPFLENSYNKVFYITSRRLIFIRYNFSLNKIKYKSIYMFDVNNIEIKKFLGRSFLSYVKLSLKSGEIYQFAPNQRLLSEKRMSEHEKIMDFFKKFENLRDPLRDPVPLL